MPRLVPCPACSRHLFVAEQACPHCGTSGSSFIAALALVVAASLTACTSNGGGRANVYGPAPQDPDQRQPTASASAATDHPPAPPVDVYGPPPRDPDQRDAPPAQPSSSAAPSASVPPKPPIAVYGPPPTSSDDRLPPGQPPKRPKP